MVQRKSNKLQRSFKVTLLHSIELGRRSLGKVGGISLLLLLLVGLLFVWMWQTKDWQAYVGAGAGGLGAILGASAGLFREGERARWILAIAGGIFTAWVTWYTVSDLNHELKEKIETADLLTKRLDTTQQDTKYYLKLISQSDLAPILTEAGQKIRDRFRQAIARRPFNERDLDSTRDGLDLMESIDSDNGHVHYFRGLIDRMLGDPGKGSQRFYAYLNKEDKSQPSTRNGELGYLPCRTPEGFCRERTAWVFHLLANYFYTEGMNRKKTGQPNDPYDSLFSDALKHACTATELFPPRGFSDPTQFIPTADLIRQLSTELGRGCKN
jgi:hypothetical protein